MAHNRFAHIFQARLETWTPLYRAWHDTFGRDEINQLFQISSAFNKAKRTIVFLAFENRFVSLGGLAAVTRYLPHYLLQAGENVCVVSPLYRNNAAVQMALKRGLLHQVHGAESVEIAGARRTMSVFVERDHPEGILCYHIGLDGYFSAESNPYAYKTQSLLLDDALAFCGVLPRALAHLGLRDNLILHANDWETALVSYTMKAGMLDGVVGAVRTVLTLHNSFDTALPPPHAAAFFRHRFGGETVLQCAIPLCDGPLTTVSTPFAHELRHDPLQRGLFCPHLQKHFQQFPPLGIENGVFGSGKKIMNVRSLSSGREGDFDALARAKQSYRKHLIELLRAMDDTRVVGSISLRAESSRIPIFFMSGRMDLVQKGFDVVFNAFMRLRKGSAKLLFSPSNPGPRELDYFAEFVRSRPGDIAIWPFRIPEQDYAACLRGSSYLLMPSLYEPFGAATEAYLHATPVIARATGGLWTQVRSAVACGVPSFYRSLGPQLQQTATLPSGILYREAVQEEGDGEWRRLLGMDVSQRGTVIMYESLITAAHEALREGVRLFQTSHEYVRLILGGIELVDEFDWHASVEAYRRVYDRTSMIGG